MSDVIPFSPRPKPEPKINSSYREGRHRVCTIEVYSDGSVNTEGKGDNYMLARVLAKAMVMIVGTAETAPSSEDRVLSALVRSLDDVIDILADDK